MEIKDIIHGSIVVEPGEADVVDSPFFQRLRLIKQLGFSEYSYPSASHSRFIHSLGAMHVATRAFDQIAGDRMPSADRRRLRSVVRMAALLHDCGHGPLSHTTEFAMPQVSELRIPGRAAENRQANHEDYTIKMILDSGLTRILERSGSEQGWTARHVAALIDRSLRLTAEEESFFLAPWEGQSTSFLPLIQQLISSELDADRMDYLRRDSTYAGVSYGHFDLDWLLASLIACVVHDPRSGKQVPQAFLAVRQRALYTVEDFLLSRYHMFLMVYFHHTGVAYDEMLGRYLSDPSCTYKLPADIDAYVHCHDSQLFDHLRNSDGVWARRIVERKPFRLLYEHHALATDSIDPLLDRLVAYLKKEQIPSLLSTSKSELSKYFRKPDLPIYVRMRNYLTDDTFRPLQDCSDLFEKYQEERWIQRVYIDEQDVERVRSWVRRPSTSLIP